MFHIVLPGLLGPVVQVDGDGHAADSVSFLLSFLRQSRQYPACEPLPTDALGFMGMAQSRPHAALSYLSDFGKLPDKLCFCCDPVHLKAGLADAVLFDAREFTIEPEDALQLIDAFNSHFAGDGMTLIFADPKRWYLLAEREITIDTLPVREVAGKNLGMVLPKGEYASVWNRLLNESQMLFFEHAVNEARQSQGFPEINGVWVYGGDAVSSSLNIGYQRIITDDALCKGVALRAGTELPDVSEETPFEIHDHTFVYSERFDAALRRRDASAWNAELCRMDELLFRPLRQAVRNKHISKVVIDTGIQGRYEFTAGGFLNAWRAIRYHRRSLQSFINITSL